MYFFLLKLLALIGAIYFYGVIGFLGFFVFWFVYFSVMRVFFCMEVMDSMDVDFIVHKGHHPCDVVGCVAFEKFDAEQLKLQARENWLKQKRMRATVLNFLGTYFWRIQS